MIALEEAKALIFMVDAATGITTLDEAMAEVLRLSRMSGFVAMRRLRSRPTVSGITFGIGKETDSGRELTTRMRLVGEHQHP